MFFFLLMFSIFFISSSNSWINCWIGLEINTLSFLTLVFNKKFLINSEFIVKYYLIQSISSINFLFFILLMNYNFINTNLFYNFILINLNMTLLMKMGSAPFHFWLISIIEGISWYNTLIILTLQKIPPMILISYYLNMKILILIIILNCFFGSLGGLNQLNLQKILTYSSIYNFSWIFSAISINESLFYFFFLIYSLIIYNLISFFSEMKIFFINQLYLMKSQKYIMFMIFMNFLSLGGLPPFLGFITKWIISMYMLQSMNMIILIMILSSLVNLYYYIQLMYPFIMIQKFEIKWSLKMKLNPFKLTFSYISLFSLILSSMLMYIY
uniref:NADH-ubiquinone oxidoreductase chain 2 n=1 Tax=Hydropsyche pellucidula TaxID=869943 RepID=A0A0U2UVZ5_9NEOP|nr:NADH dehydrogenase subunit 2 [Hydropsyche pellucidula]ALT58521.1 NADH dehydrogenase subunit 2 [Hydropsyche pellucidula]